MQVPDVCQQPPPREPHVATSVPRTWAVLEVLASAVGARSSTRGVHIQCWVHKAFKQSCSREQSWHGQELRSHPGALSTTLAMRSFRCLSAGCLAAERSGPATLQRHSCGRRAFTPETTVDGHTSRPRIHTVVDHLQVFRGSSLDGCRTFKSDATITSCAVLEKGHPCNLDRSTAASGPGAS